MRHLLVILLALVALTMQVLSSDTAYEALGSPVLAVALASVATAVTLWRRQPLKPVAVEADLDVRPLGVDRSAPQAA